LVAVLPAYKSSVSAALIRDSTNSARLRSRCVARMEARAPQSGSPPQFHATRNPISQWSTRSSTPTPRYADRFYLVAEVLSDSLRDIIGLKHEVYRAHPTCTCILPIRQDRPEIIVDQRTAARWQSQVLQAGGQLVLPAFGLSGPGGPSPHAARV